MLLAPAALTTVREEFDRLSDRMWNTGLFGPPPRVFETMWSAPSHLFLEHTGEMHLRVRAGSLAELLAEAGRALAGLLIRGGRNDAVGPWVEIEVRSGDRAALLVDWLNELIYRTEAELEAPTDFEVQEVGEACVRARIRGVPIEGSAPLVKAATLHGARVEPVEGGFEGDVVLDV